MKLELGCGDRPTEGYMHQDVISLCDLDYCCNPWELPIENDSLDEVLAVGVMEHLRYEDFKKTIEKVHDILKPEGIFLFDVPDIVVWIKYLNDYYQGKEVPFEREHIYSTIWGWQRWPGDEHKWGWDEIEILNELESIGFDIYKMDDGFEDIKSRVERRRFTRPEDAHIYVKAIK